MSNPLLLEICVESVDRAVSAERGGAHRVELCSDLSSGGITPSAGLMETARRHVHIPIHILIRPRAGDFLYTDYELEIMERDIRIAKQLRMNGIVLGLLDDKKRVDVERTRELVRLANPLPVTFHRAFDQCKDMFSALEAVAQTGAKRILTSGGKASVSESLVRLADLVESAGRRIVVMPGGGIGPGNVQRVLQKTGAGEIHTSLGMSNVATNGTSRSNDAVAKQTRNSTEFEEKVRKVRAMLDARTRENDFPIKQK
jgi:copper homeostasis protein